jgi:hypothetical protein
MALNLEDPTGGFLDPLGIFDVDKSNPYTSNKGAFDKYAAEMDEASKRWTPWMERGNRAGEIGFNAYQRDIENPNYMQDKIAAGFEMSPYQKYMQDLVTKRLNYNSANTGMMGSGAANRALMEELTKSTGQFQNEYINRGLGLYGQALSGMHGIAGQGIQAGTQQDEMLQEAAGGRLKGEMGENETNDRNRAAIAARQSALKGAILGAAGTVVGTYFGGKEGGKAGGQMGASIGYGSPEGRYQGPSGGGGGGYGGGSGNWSY